MDVGAVLRTARQDTYLSQDDLADLAGTSGPTISSYENGKRSPTVRTLDRLLAACGVQLRAELEPLRAELDARVAAYTGGAPGLSESWAGIADVLDDCAPSVGIWKPPRQGAVTWAVDGASALVLHGFAAPADDVTFELVVVINDALRYWLKAMMIQGIDEKGFPVTSWFDLDPDDMRAALADIRPGSGGLFALRLVEDLGPTLSVEVPWLDRTIKVVTVDEVERAHPEHREVLERWRETRDRQL